MEEKKAGPHFNMFGGERHQKGAFAALQIPMNFDIFILQKLCGTDSKQRCINTRQT